MGHRVYLCSGRSKAEVDDNLWNIGFDGMIGGKGSFVEDNGSISLEHKKKAKEAFIGMRLRENPVREDLNKFTIIYPLEMTLEDIQTEFSDYFDIAHGSFVLKEANLGEISQKGVNKGKAIETLLAYLEVDKSDTICIGDSLNDF